MNASLRALLSGVVDYAGLFPPAQLPLDQAIRNYARYRQEADAWMLGRFVIPAARLTELDAFMNILEVGAPHRLSILGRGGDDQETYLEGMVSDYIVMRRFSAQHVGRFVADVYEARPPAGGDVAFLTNLTAEIFQRQRSRLFMEGVLDANAEGSLAAAMRHTTARFKQKGPDKSPKALTGYKLRCGGLEPSAIPTIDQVAFVLRVCRDADIPVKFTAGLHHPIRWFDAGLNAYLHGFVNVFVAGVLAHARRLDEETLRAVIADEDPGHFVFTDDGLSWKALHTSTAEIAAARRDFVTSFGSCSFDEPRDDLRALGWL